jgi:hypothetical protein
MEEDAVKNSAFRMTWAIDPAHSRDSDSRNVPGRRNDYHQWFHTHLDVSDEDKRKFRFKPQTLRLSVGIEDSDDLCSDLDS